MPGSGLRALPLLLIVLQGGCGGADLLDFDGDGTPDSADCAPEDPSVYPSAWDPVDAAGLDANCDGVDGVDSDGDGYASEGSGGLDCNDGEPAVNPGSPEVADDGLDNDCVGGDALCDADGDLSAAAVCGGDDCDDANSLVHPGASELCDGVDTDCDGEVGAAESDADGDGVRGCAGDCADDDAAVSPELVEVCDGRDTDCDGAVPEGESDIDADGVMPCAGDCDDADPGRHPGAEEVCDAVDTDCDGALGDGDEDLDGDGDPACTDCAPTDASTHTLDLDGDGVTACDGDCDDQDPDRTPGAVDPWGDGFDADCDEVDGVDADGDGVASNGVPPDCSDDPLDPLAASLWPGAVDTVGDGVDQDCDGLDGVDADGDGFASVASGGADCSDDPSDAYAAVTFPGANDLVGNAIDTDCDGIDGVDDDGDGVASIGSGGGACNDDPTDPEAASTWPGAPDAVGDGVDQDCDGLDGVDADGDGVASVATGGSDCDDDPASPLAAVTSPFASDGWGDGDDTNCDGIDGQDGDGDGWAANAGGDLADCDDADPMAWPGSELAWDSPRLGRDVDCDGDFSHDLAEASASITGVTGQDEQLGADDQFGQGLGAGDIDGDGVPDLLMATVGWPDEYVLHGATLLANPAATSSDADVVLTSGAAYFSTTLVGDVDGDGLADVLASPYPWTEHYLFLGSTLLGGGTLTVVDADVVVDGVATAVAAAGDVDGDGLGDLLFGLPWSDEDAPDGGRAFLLLGSTLVGGGAIGLDSADVVFQGTVEDAEYGRWVASAGDVDGDGLDDVVIGTWEYSDGSVVALASSLELGGVYDLGQPDVELAETRLGGASHGDFDGDGLADLLVTPFLDGDAHVVFGSTLVGGGVLTESDLDVSFPPEVELDGAGEAATAIGDFDGDGLDDLVVGAPFHDAGFAPDDDRGKAYVMLGSTIAAGGTFPLASSDAQFVGGFPGMKCGWSVSGAGDMNGDGRDDLLVGCLGGTTLVQAGDGHVSLFLSR